MRLLSVLWLSALLLVPSCRHSREPIIAHEGSFLAGGCHFVPQGRKSHRLSLGEAGGELIGRVHSTGIPIRIKASRQGNYSRYALEVRADGGARGKAELSARGRRASACVVVAKDGSIETLQAPPEQLRSDWVALIALDGNICMMAWNRQNGGYNAKFYAKNAKRGEAVYKVLEVDDPRYHDEGFPLRELRED